MFFTLLYICVTKKHTYNISYCIIPSIPSHEGERNEFFIHLSSFLLSGCVCEWVRAKEYNFSLFFCVQCIAAAAPLFQQCTLGVLLWFGKHKLCTLWRFPRIGRINCNSLTCWCTGRSHTCAHFYANAPGEVSWSIYKVSYYFPLLTSALQREFSLAGLLKLRSLCEFTHTNAL